MFIVITCVGSWFWLLLVTRTSPDRNVPSRSIAGLAGRWFNWRTDGGGRGYVVSTTGSEIHYGEVELQVLKYR